MTTREIVTTLKKVEKFMIPPDGVKRKLDGVVDSVPPDKGCEVLYGELTLNNGIKVIVKVCLIVMISTFC